MTDPKRGENTSFMPVVSDATLDALTNQYADRDTDNQGWGQLLVQMQKRLTATNPNVVLFINRQVDKRPPEQRQAVIETVLGMLVLLERQAEVDDLNKQFATPRLPQVTPETMLAVGQELEARNGLSDRVLQEAVTTQPNLAALVLEYAKQNMGDENSIKAVFSGMALTLRLLELQVEASGSA